MKWWQCSPSQLPEPWATAWAFERLFGLVAFLALCALIGWSLG